MPLSKSWDLQLDPGIYKTLKKAPRRDAEAILDVIRLLPADPYFGDIQKMKGIDSVWRRRVGSFRIFYINKRGESENVFSFSPSAVDIYPKTFRKPVAFGYIKLKSPKVSSSSSPLNEEAQKRTEKLLKKLRMRGAEERKSEPYWKLR